MGDIIPEMQIRIAQHKALYWAWTLLRYRDIQESMERIFNMLTMLGNENVDFEALIKDLEEEAEGQ